MHNLFSVPGSGFGTSVFEILPQGFKEWMQSVEIRMIISRIFFENYFSIIYVTEFLCALFKISVWYLGWRQVWLQVTG